MNENTYYSFVCSRCGDRLYLTELVGHNPVWRDIRLYDRCPVQYRRKWWHLFGPKHEVSV